MTEKSLEVAVAEESSEAEATEESFEVVVGRAAKIITEITGVVLPEKPLAEIHLLDDLDIDSLSLVEVVVALEEELASTSMTTQRRS